MARANEDLPESVRVRRFVLLHKQFDPDDDEITRTRKVRRSVINERYAAIIDALGGARLEVEIKSVGDLPGRQQRDPQPSPCPS